MLTARIYADYTSRVVVRSRTAILYPPALQVAGSPVYTFSIYAAALGSSLGLDHVRRHTGTDQQQHLAAAACCAKPEP